MMLACGNYFHYWGASSERHKCRSGSSVSEAALHFGNLGVFKPSALRIEEAFQFAACNAGPHNCHEDGNGHLPSL